VILLDTCTMIFDVLAPEKLSKKAAMELEKGRQSNSLACSDISLWEIAMLISKERLKPAMPPQQFLADVIAANKLRVLPITPAIAFFAAFHADLAHGDPADRIIAATALHHKTPLMTCDAKLRKIPGLKSVW
jgi:PIN domain nuclease of toxin-antitoxin system